MKKNDAIRSLAEEIAKTLAKHPRSTWPGLIAVALSGFRERVKDETRQSSPKKAKARPSDDPGGEQGRLG